MKNLYCKTINKQLSTNYIVYKKHIKFMKFFFIFYFFIKINIIIIYISVKRTLLTVCSLRLTNA
jgi:hypothetical protein